jgi:hypothetical protein
VLIADFTPCAAEDEFCMVYTRFANQFHLLISYRSDSRTFAFILWQTISTIRALLVAALIIIIKPCALSKWDINFVTHIRAGGGWIIISLYQPFSFVQKEAEGNFISIQGDEAICLFEKWIAPPIANQFHLGFIANSTCKLMRRLAFFAGKSESM